jgi:hypothetical protein
MFNISFLWVVLGFLGEFTAATDGEQCWPQFRGPNATGVATSGEYVTEFNEATNLIWKTDLP